MHIHIEPQTFKAILRDGESLGKGSFLIQGICHYSMMTLHTLGQLK